MGGGAGLNQGKDRTKEMIESFGGIVTSAVSGKTNFLLAGRDPGRSKVSQADKKNVPFLGRVVLCNCNQVLLVNILDIGGVISSYHSSDGFKYPPRLTFNIL